MDQFTIASDDEIEPEVISQIEHDDSDNELNCGFNFDEQMSVKKIVKKKSKKINESEKVSNEPAVDDNIRAMPHTEERAQRAEKKIKTKKVVQIEQDSESGDDEEGSSDEDTDAEEENYFDEIVQDDGSGELMFSQLNLSRPLLRAVERSGYTNPTPIQGKVIPIALAGRDVCASAVTGSGKTAAFTLPFLERLLYRPKEQACTRVLVIAPTRELATQIFEVLTKLSVFTDITSCLICGGKKDLKSQEAVLRNRPDVVVCTPGRIIDHLRNSHSISIRDLDVLVLDEVDRLLELGFQEELEELLKYCPVNRQTLLFSATLTSKVDSLAKLSLKRPVRVKVNYNSTTVAPRLVQEFIKLRDTAEREAYLAALVCRTYNKRVIIFFETKVEAHRFCALLKLLGLKATELHGNLAQHRRYAALQEFRDQAVDILVATDVAARGLDIPGVQAVLNSEMPRTASSYVHRVGRTARAGCGGRSITLVSDARRKVMKEVLKGGELGTQPGTSADKSAAERPDTVDAEPALPTNTQVLTRSVPASTIAHYIGRIAAVEGKIVDLLREESLNEKMDVAAREADKAQNMVTHLEEIEARPARTWYQTETAKQALKTASKENSESELLALQRGEPKKKRVNTAHPDDYRQDEKDREKDLNKGQHSMSRVKRRRMEAMRGVEEEDNLRRGQREARGIGVEGDADEGAGPKVKSAKTLLREKEASASGLTHVYQDNESLGSMTLKNRRTKDGKIKRQAFATGGLDADMKQWGMLSGAEMAGSSASRKGAGKYASREEKELKEFKEWDNNKKQLGKKKGNKAFKSKAKHKRR